LTFDSIIFSPSDTHQCGTLAKYLKIFDDAGINLSHIESRSSTRGPGYEFMVECDALAAESSTDQLHDALEAVREKSGYFQIISRAYHEEELADEETEVVPWFPRRIRELDRFANQILSYGAELDSDHPGFTDPVYRKRRQYFADIAYNYRHGEPVSKSYTQSFFRDT
jgi:phenylalanine-4-hydroxylase